MQASQKQEVFDVECLGQATFDKGGQRVAVAFLVSVRKDTTLLTLGIKKIPRGQMIKINVPGRHYFKQKTNIS